jgi:hypothetical protein
MSRCCELFFHSPFVPISRVLRYRSTISAAGSQVHLQSCIEAIDRTGGKNNWPRAVAFIQEKVTVSPYTVHRMPNFALREASLHATRRSANQYSSLCNIYRFPFVLHIESVTANVCWWRHECTCCIQTVVCLCKHVAVGLPPIWVDTEAGIPNWAAVCVSCSILSPQKPRKVWQCGSSCLVCEGGWWVVCFVKYTTNAHFDIIIIIVRPHKYKFSMMAVMK